MLFWQEIWGVSQKNSLKELQSTSSWIGHAKYGNTYNLRKKIMKGLKLKGGQMKNEKEDYFFNDSRDYDI